MKVLLIPEDPKHDQYILKPLVTRLFADLGKTPRVEVLSRPRLRGVAQALDATILADVVATYPMVDLFLVLVDRDGQKERAAVAAAREAEHSGRLLVELAIEEVETWMLALHAADLEARWQDVRKEIDVKERFAHPFLKRSAPSLSPGEGRAWAMRGLGAQQWKGMCRRCPELASLEQRIGNWLTGRADSPAISV